MQPTDYVSTHSVSPRISQPSGQVEVTLLGDAWRSMLRLVGSINQPFLNEIEYEEGSESIFRFSTVGRECFVILKDDNYISRSLAGVGSYGFESFEAAMRILDNPLDILVDVGANIGSISIPAVARGYAKQALAVEPDRLNFRTLMANIYLNDLQERMTGLNSALGANPDDVLEFQLSPDNKGDHRVRATDSPGAFGEEGWPRVSVPSTNLDSLIEPHRLLSNPKQALIWMDVQGWEPRVLAGAQQILKKAIPFVIEFWPYALKRNGLLEELIDQIAAHFRTIHVVSWQGAPMFPATHESVHQILNRLDLNNALSTCDLLLTVET